MNVTSLVVSTCKRRSVTSHWAFLAAQSNGVLPVHIQSTFVYCQHPSVCIRNLGLISPIRSQVKSCYSHIRELRCIRPYLDSKTASTIAASIGLPTSNLTTVTLSATIFLIKSHTICINRL